MTRRGEAARGAGAAAGGAVELHEQGRGVCGERRRVGREVDPVEAARDEARPAAAFPPRRAVGTMRGLNAGCFWDAARWSCRETTE